MADRSPGQSVIFGTALPSMVLGRRPESAIRPERRIHVHFDRMGGTFVVVHHGNPALRAQPVDHRMRQPGHVVWANSRNRCSELDKLAPRVEDDFKR